MYTLNTYDIISENQYSLLNEYLKLESIHPEDIINNKNEVLHEAIISNIKIKKTIDNIIEALEKSVKKFKDISRELRRKNAEWLANAEQFDLSKTDLSNFKQEIFPYWLSIPSKFNIKIPKFTIEDEMLYDNESEFMKKYFKDIIDEEGNVNKNILRGLSNNITEKVVIDAAKVKNSYRQILGLINDIDKLRNKVSRDMVSIINTVKSIRNMTSPINESTLLSNSIFKDEYFDILLERVVTPDDIEESMGKKDEKNTIDIDKKDNNESKETNNQYKNVVSWSKMCTHVTTAEMDVLDEAYSDCVKFISAVMKSK